jgi:tetratricopeptide (TPR) repeat protein
MDAPMRQINTRFFLLLVGGAAALTAALFGVHRLQAGNIAAALLWQADQAEKGGRATLAARYLGRYLEFVPDDIEQRAHLATILSDPKVVVTPKDYTRAKFVIEQVLAWDPQRHDLRQALCRLALARGQLDLAKEHLDYLNAKLPESGDVALLVGRWHELDAQRRPVPVKDDPALARKDFLQRMEPALKNYRRAVQAEPAKVEAYLRLTALCKQLDFGSPAPAFAAEVDRLVAAALANAPDDAAVLSLAAQRAQEKNDAAAARKYLEAGLQRDPKEPRLYQALSRLHAQAGDRAEAIARLKKGLQAVAKEHQFELTWTLANVLLDDEQMDEAKKLIVQIRDVNALSAEYLEARCLMQQGRWYDAAGKLDRLRPSFKTVPELAFQAELYLGLCYQKVGEPVLQLAAFQRAIKADATSLAARHGEATALWALGQRDDSLARFRQLIAGNSNRKEAARWRLEYARMLLGHAQSGPGPNPAALEKVRGELDEADKEMPGSVECALLRAELLFAQKQPAQAEAELRQALKADARRFEPWIALASLAMGSKEPARAETLLAEAAAAVPDSAEFRVAQVHFRREYQSKAPDALKALEKGCEQFEARGRARLLEALAEAHFQAGRPDEAARLLRQLAGLPLHKQDIRVRMQLLSLALAQGDEPEMQRVLAEVKQVEGDGGPEGSYGEALRLIWRHRQGQQADALKQARALLTVAATRRPDWHALYLARAEIDELEGKHEQAIVNYRQAIQFGSRDPQGIYQLVLLLCEAQRFEEADAEIRKLKQVGADADAGRLVVAILYNRQDYKGAAALMQQMVRADSKDFRDHLRLGVVLSSGGRASSEAEAAFRRAVALGEKQPEAWVGLVRYLAATGQLAKALQEIDVADQKLGGDTRLLALASCYEVLGALDRAEQYYYDALQAQAQSPPINRAAADFYLRAGKVKNAEALYRHLLDKLRDASDADRAAARRGLALALAKGGEPQRTPEALELAGLALDQTGRLDDKTLAAEPEARLGQARVLAAMNSHALRGKAIELLEELNKKQLLHAEDQYQLARLLHLHGPDPANWMKSREVLKAITTSHPTNARYLAYHANLLLLHKELPDADALIARLEQMEKDRQLPAGVLGSVEMKARALEMRGKELAAIALLQSFAEQKDAPPARALLLASLHGRLGNYQEAIDWCDRVRQIGGSYREEAYGAAISILRAGKPAAAKSVKLKLWQQQADRVEANLRESTQWDTDNVVLRLQLADLMELVGRFDQVESICRDLLKKDPDNLVALNNLAWLLAGKEGQGQEALALINRAIAKYGARPELLDTRAVAYVALGMAKEAVRDLEQVIRESPTPTRYFHLSRAHHLAKDTPLAVAALRRANELGLSFAQLHPTDQEAYRQLMAQMPKN